MKRKIFLWLLGIVAAIDRWFCRRFLGSRTIRFEFDLKEPFTYMRTVTDGKNQFRCLGKNYFLLLKK